MYFGFAVRVEVGQYPAVSAKDVVDIADEVVTVPVQAVVIAAAAVCRAELLVGSTDKLFAAFYTLFFHGLKALWVTAQ